MINWITLIYLYLYFISYLYGMKRHNVTLDNVIKICTLYVQLFLNASAKKGNTVKEIKEKYINQ